MSTVRIHIGMQVADQYCLDQDEPEFLAIYQKIALRNQPQVVIPVAVKHTQLQAQKPYYDCTWEFAYTRPAATKRKNEFDAEPENNKRQKVASRR